VFPRHSPRSHSLLLAAALSLGCLAMRTFGEEPRVVSNDYLLTKWDQDDGMPGNTVSALAQGRDGYLWIGTYDGLARFDGTQFLTFPSGHEGLPAGKIRSLVEDRAGFLWIGMEGAAVVRERGAAFETLLPPSRDPDDWLTSLACDSRNRVWAGFSQRRARSWDHDRWVTFTGSSVPGDGSVSFSTDSVGKVWFTTENSYGYVDDEKLVPLATDVPFPQLHPRAAGGFWLVRGNVLLIRNEQQQLIYGVEVPWRGGATEVQVLFEDRRGVLWIGTKGQGLFRFDGDFVRVPTSHNYILSVTEDTEGNTWVGTLGGGVIRLHPRKVRLHDEKNGLPADVIDAVCEDGEGGLWFAARNAGPIRFFGGKYMLFTATDGWSGGFLTTLCPDGKGGVWFGTLSEGLIHWSHNVFEQVGLKGERIQALCADQQGGLWVSTDRQLIQWRDGKQVTEYANGNAGIVTAMVRNEAGVIWFGRQSGALSSLDGENWHPVDLGPGMTAAIRCMVADNHGHLWIGTSEGLIRLTGTHAVRLTEAQGLPSEDIRQLVENGDELWIGTVRGLCQVPVSQLDAVVEAHRSRVECSTFGREDGLGSIEFAEGNGQGACRSQDGHLWFATRRGVAEINPAELKRETSAPPVHIEKVIVDDRPQTVSPSGTAEVSPGSQKIEIHYTAVALSAPEKLRFRYRMTPGDRNWTNAGADRVAIFHGLAPGDYHFEVEATTHDFAVAVRSPGTGQGSAGFAFRIHPAFHQRIGFRVLCGASLLALAGFGVRLWTLRRLRRRLQILEREQALEAERARIARDMHDELGASLTSISLLSEQVRAQTAGLPADAAKRIEKISQAAHTVSRTLDEIVWTVNPRNDTLEGLVGYIGEYAAEFLSPSGIRLTLDLPVEVPAMSFSSEIRHQLLLVVKEALNNAVKSAAAREITIRVVLENGQLQMQIADDGKGFQAGANGRFANGLGNMQERLLTTGGRCEIDSAPGAGTRINVTLPLPRTANL